MEILLQVDSSSQNFVRIITNATWGLRFSAKQQYAFVALALSQDRRKLDVARNFCAKIAGEIATSIRAAASVAHICRMSEMDVQFSQEREIAFASSMRSLTDRDVVTDQAVNNPEQEVCIMLLAYYYRSWLNGIVSRQLKPNRMVPLLKLEKNSTWPDVVSLACIGQRIGNVNDWVIRAGLYLERYDAYPYAMADSGEVALLLTMLSSFRPLSEHKTLKHHIRLFLDDNVAPEAILIMLESVEMGWRKFKWIRDHFNKRG